MKKVYISLLFLIFSISCISAQTTGIDTTGKKISPPSKIDTTEKKTSDYSKIVDTTEKKTTIPSKIDTSGKKVSRYTKIDTTGKAPQLKRTGISMDFETQRENWFQLKDVKFKKSSGDTLLVTGKISNKSGRSYPKSATFQFFIFDSEEALLGNGTFRVTGLENNKTVPFTAKLYAKVEPELVGKYKAHFMKGN